MTVPSRGARVRRGGRRPGWVSLTALLVLAIGASSALVFTNQVELLKLAVILALWAAVAAAFVSVAYRRQSDADAARVRDLKLVYDLQLDREISARREYELTVESQLRRELVSELSAQSADDVAALRAELGALRTSLQVLFDTDLAQRPELETPETEGQPARAYSEWDRTGEGRAAPADWVASDRVTADEPAIIDVPEEPLVPPRQPEPQPQPEPEPAPAPQAAPQAAAESRPRQGGRGWQPPPANGPWVPPTAEPGWRRSRHATPDEPANGAIVEPRPEPAPHADSGRRARSRHSVEYREYGVSNFTNGQPAPEPTPPPEDPAAPAPRHRGPDHAADGSEPGPATDGQSVAELLARMQVAPSTGGKRRRRDS